MRNLLWALCSLLITQTSTLYGWEGLRRDGTCLKTGKKCISTLGNAGSYGLSCCDPFSPNADQCVMKNPCRGGKLYRWPTENLPIKWSVNFNNMPGNEGFINYSSSELLQVFKRAWDAWSAPKCTGLKHRYSGITSTNIDPEDKKLVIYLPSKKEWILMGQDFSTLAFSRPMADEDGRIYDADIAISPRSRLSPWQKGPSTSIDLVAVIAHEIGHSLGFGHSPHKTLMYFANLTGKFRGLSHDEIAGICELYPKLNCENDNTCGKCFQCIKRKCKIKSIKKIDKFCKPCKISSDCGKGNYCVFTAHGKRCLQGCTSPDNCCPKGYHCRNLNWGINVCWPNSNRCPLVACKSDSQCGEGERCEGEFCRPAPVKPTPDLCKSPGNDGKCGKKSVAVKFPDGLERCAMPCSGGSFCPDGFSCRAISGNRICLPEDWICPCQDDGDCLSKERCLNGKCRPKECGFKCLCSEKAACPPGFICTKFGEYQICLQRCGRPVFSIGHPGSPCLPDGSCKDDAQCLKMRGGVSICFRPCGRNSPCAKGMGFCSSFGRHGLCVCYDDKDCDPKRGIFCNRDYLNAWGIGVCSRVRSLPKNCSGDFTCKKFEGGRGICLPSAKGVGGSCGGLVTCREGGVCVAFSSTREDRTQRGICLELCGPSQRCWGGGRCGLSLSDGSKACNCRNDSHCLIGQSCRRLPQGISICSGKVSSACGDGKCQPDRGENCRNCPMDCTCYSGEFCSEGGECRPLKSCGDGVCQVGDGENCFNCSADCGCPAGYLCRRERCIYSPDKIERNGYQLQSSCDCSSGGEQSAFPLWTLFFIWLGGGFILRKILRRKTKISH